MLTNFPVPERWLQESPSRFPCLLGLAKSGLLVFTLTTPLSLVAATVVHLSPGLVCILTLSGSFLSPGE